MIKLGNAFIDERAIEAIQVTDESGICYAPDAENTLRIELASGTALDVKAAYNEVVAALTACGLLDKEPEPQQLSAEDCIELIRLDADGYRWLARDKDGKVYAYQVRPILAGAYWEGANTCQFVEHEFEFDIPEQEPPLNIRETLQAFGAGR